MSRQPPWEYAKRKKIDKVDFVRDFDQILTATASARFEDRPTMVLVNEVRFSKVVWSAPSADGTHHARVAFHDPLPYRELMEVSCQPPARW